ncbi:peptidoglycan amidohydrolase family protein, partial [Streptococcus canis]
LPSYAITVLHFEGLWGTSAVGKTDNNWGGMTWIGKGERPSGVTVTQGTARPSNEGGYYMHYSSVDDFLTDWFYLLRAGGSYKVSGAKTFSEAVKGMFKV